MTQTEPVHVYFMPGLAVDSMIFDNIMLPRDRFIVHMLEWIIPEKDETIKAYASRMTRYVKHENPVLAGVSFGGVVVQEMSELIQVKRVIIISSVKCRDEFPSRLRFAAKTGAFKLLPLGLLDYVDHFEKIAVSKFLKKRARLYKKYLSVRNQQYLKWSIKNMVMWECESPRPEVIHIHGDKDVIFPIKNIENCIIVKGGTHIMIVDRYKWFNKNLPEIITTGKLQLRRTI